MKYQSTNEHTYGVSTTVALGFLEEGAGNGGGWKEPREIEISY